MATRRQVLAQLAIGLGVVACRSSFAQPAEDAAYVAVETSAVSGRSRAVFFTPSGARAAITPLDFRAHGMAQHGATLVVFPRRPGHRFAAVNLDTMEIRAVVSAPPDRHFYGHGAFTADGRHLLVAENDLETLGGNLAIYDVARGMRRVDHIRLPGPGPHDIIRIGDGDRFHVALGGLETHPDYGRTPLNLSAFRSQALTLDLATGDIEPMGHWLGTEGVSLRHLARDDEGRLYLGGQTVDARRAGASHVLWLVRDGRAVPLPAGDRLGGYASSVAASGRSALVTSKISQTVLRLDGERLVETHRLDGASAAAIGPGLTASSGYQTLALNEHRISVTDGHEFDNHGFGLMTGQAVPL